MSFLYYNYWFKIEESVIINCSILGHVLEIVQSFAWISAVYQFERLLLNVAWVCWKIINQNLPAKVLKDFFKTIIHDKYIPLQQLITTVIYVKKILGSLFHLNIKVLAKTWENGYCIMFASKRHESPFGLPSWTFVS